MGAFHPALCLGSASARNRDAWCWVGAPLARMVFIMENCIWRSENAHFFPAARASYSVRYLSPPPIRPKSRVTPVGRSTGTLHPTGKNRVLGGVFWDVLTAVNSLAQRVAGALSRVAGVRDRRGRGDRNPRNCMPAETAATPPPICTFRNHRVLTRAGGSIEHGVLSEALDSRRAQCARDRGARQCWHTCARPARAA